VEGKSLIQTQREALVDLLVWTMFVDRHIAAAEEELVEQMAEALPWDSPHPWQLFLDSSIRRTREVLGRTDAEAEYLQDITTRLVDPGAREHAYLACEELVAVDGEIAGPEKAHLERLRVKLGRRPV
jgi:hypothetical protein